MAVPQKNTTIQSGPVAIGGNTYVAQVASTGPEAGQILSMTKNGTPISYADANSIYSSNKSNFDASVNQQLNISGFNNPNVASSTTGLADNKLFDKTYNDLKTSGGAAGTIDNSILANLTGSAVANKPQPPSTKGKIYVFPVDINVGKFGGATNSKNTPQDYLRIGALKYTPPSPGLIGNEPGVFPAAYTTKILTTGLESFNNSVPAKLDFEGEVVLPMPMQVTDGTKAEWGMSRMDFLGLGMASMLGQAADIPIAGDIGSLLLMFDEKRQQQVANATFGVAAGGAMAAKMTGSPSAMEALRSDIISQVIAKVSNTPAAPADLLARSSGKAVNPNAELLFRAPSIRAFNLQWKLIPRSEQEAKRIREIIRFLKVNMLPYTPKGSSILLQTPNVFVLRYETAGGKLNKSLPKPKLCALGEVQVNHSPDGVGWAAYSDSHPVATSLGLSFVELTPLLGNDYASYGEDDVGL